MIKYTVENLDSVLFTTSDLSDALVKGLILSKTNHEPVRVFRVAETTNGFESSIVRTYAAA